MAWVGHFPMWVRGVVSGRATLHSCVDLDRFYVAILRAALLAFSCRRG